MHHGMGGLSLDAHRVLALCEGPSGTGTPCQAFKACWTMQVHVLSLRFLRSWYRCPVNLAIQGAQYIFFALLIGGVHPLSHAVVVRMCRASLYSA